MQNNYAKLIKENLDKVFSGNLDELAANLPAEKHGDAFVFRAFGEECRVSPAGITLGDLPPESILGLLVSLYTRRPHPIRAA